MSCHPKTNLQNKFHPNRTMGMCSNPGWKVPGEGWREFRRNTFQTLQMAAQNESTYVASFIQTRQWESVQNQEARFGGEWGWKFRGERNIEKKKCEHRKWQTKLNLCRKFHPNRTMGSCSKMRGKVWGKRGEREFWEEGISKIKCKRQKYHPKMNLWRKFHPNRTMGKC